MDSDKTALRLSRQFASFIRLNRFSAPNVEFEGEMANYNIYTLKATGGYRFLVRVGYTVVYAYSEEENTDAVRDIMAAIGYFKNDISTDR